MKRIATATVSADRQRALFCMARNWCRVEPPEPKVRINTLKTIAPGKEIGLEDQDSRSIRAVRIKAISGKISPPPGKVVAIRMRNLGRLFQESSYLIGSIYR